MDYQPHELVFIDESSFDRRTSIRNKGWALKGKRVVKKVYFHRGARLVPILCCSAVCDSSSPAIQFCQPCHSKGFSMSLQLQVHITWSFSMHSFKSF